MSQNALSLRVFYSAHAVRTVRSSAAISRNHFAVELTGSCSLDRTHHQFCAVSRLAAKLTAKSHHSREQRRLLVAQLKRVVLASEVEQAVEELAEWSHRTQQLPGVTAQQQLAQRHTGQCPSNAWW